MANTTPTTPKFDRESQVFRRSFTLPPKLVDTPKSQGSDKYSSSDIETLFAHQGGKIVSFSPSLGYSRSRSASLTGTNPDSEPIGTLPWASNTERTIATGHLSIYRVLGSVAFLSSGKTVHPILPKSQCWCVDAETKFVLRIRQNSYYRIELPNTCAEDRRVADELKQVLGKVLQYETTPCPFKRSFTVELPESPSTPTKKRPWTPKHRPQRLSEIMSQPSSYKEKRSVPDTESVEGTDDEHSLDASEDEQKSEVSEDAAITPPDHDIINFVDLGNLKTSNHDEPETPSTVIFDGMKPMMKPNTLTSIRSVTAPPQLSFQTSPPSSSSSREMTPDAKDADNVSIASLDSFQSFHSFHSSASPPSPPYSDPPSPPQKSNPNLVINVPRSRQHKREASELTITPESLGSPTTLETPTWISMNSPTTPVNPETPPLTNDATSQKETPSPPTTLRRRASRRRAHSPLPSPANLYTPRTRLSGHHLTTAILQKTCSLLLGPPVQLVALMLNIAARITNGAFRGPSLVYVEGGKTIPGTWDYSDDEDGSNDFWEEDDYGISIGVMPSVRSGGSQEMGGSWELD